jgi:hypothetical protein
MPTATQIRSSVKVGQVYDVTNHFIQRADHPCFGTRRVTVTAVNGSSFTLDNAQWGTRWPKASQLQQDADGTIRMFGGGAGQKPDDPFLTLVPVTQP